MTYPFLFSIFGILTWSQNLLDDIGHLWDDIAKTTPQRISIWRKFPNACDNQARLHIASHPLSWEDKTYRGEL